MTTVTTKRPPQKPLGNPLFVPHSSWARLVPPATAPKLLRPDEFWDRLGL